MKSVVVTGRGVVTSIAESPDALFDALLGGASGIADGIGACVDFDPEPAMSAREARRADRFTQFAASAAKAAADEAGIPDGADPARTGVVIGTGVGGLETLERECRTWIEGGDRAVSPYFVPMMMPNAAAGIVAMMLGIHGPGFSVASACATGSHAIGEAKRMIERGEADVVLAGGAEAALTGLCMAATAPRPFSSGWVMWNASLDAP
ncbi:MAG: 3-oxoacyl-[acyl-carrier-protein] synthase [Solirubrobacteraceae bacterium]|nr:3-oxoacyl-[acyl-carrier-protein] synthase [Solirubrobacteraceae bacterium]